MNVNLVSYQSLFNEVNVSSNFTNVDNLVVNDSLNFTTATLTGPTANWPTLQNTLNTMNTYISDNTNTLDALIPDVNANTLAITALQSRATTDEGYITTNTTNITSNTSAITALQSRATTDEGYITTNTTNISSNTSAITALQSRATTDEATLSSVQTTANGALQTNGSNHMTGAFLAANGTVGAPSLSFNSDSDTGLYSVSANVIGVATGGSNRLSVSSSTLTTSVDLMPSVNSTNNLGSTSYYFNNVCGNLLYLQYQTYLVGSADTITPNWIQLGNNTIGISNVPGGLGYLMETGFSHLFYINGVCSLTISSSALTATVPYYNSSGSVSAPTYTFTGTTNTGIYSSASHNLDFSTNGVNRLNINTSALTSTLPIIYPAGAVGAPSITFSGNTTNGIYSSASNNIDFATNGVNRLNINNSDIVSTVPLYNANGSVSAPAYSFTNSTSSGMYSSAANNLDFTANNTHCLNMTSTNMQQYIDLVPSANSARNLGSASLCYSDIFTDGVAFSNNAVTSSTTAPNKITLYSNGTNVYGLSILSSTMGFISPATSNFNFYSGGTLYFQITTTSINPKVLTLAPDGSSSNPSYSFANSTGTGMSQSSNLLSFSVSGNLIMQLSTTVVSLAIGTIFTSLGGINLNGNLIGNATNTYSCGTSTGKWTAVYATNGTIQTSDRRIKNSITDIDLGLDFIKKLRPVSYKWDDDVCDDKVSGKTVVTKHKRTHLGLIAQEVEKTLSDNGKTLNDVDIVDNDALTDPAGYDRYSIRYHSLIPILIKSIQELSERVTFLEGQLNKK